MTTRTIDDPPDRRDPMIARRRNVNNRAKESRRQFLSPLGCASSGRYTSVLMHCEFEHRLRWMPAIALLAIYRSVGMLIPPGFDRIVQALCTKRDEINKISLIEISSTVHNVVDLLYKTLNKYVSCLDECRDRKRRRPNCRPHREVRKRRTLVGSQGNA